jgi:hypothetical protein
MHRSGSWMNAVSASPARQARSSAGSCHPRIPLPSDGAAEPVLPGYQTRLSPALFPRKGHDGRRLGRPSEAHLPNAGAPFLVAEPADVSQPTNYQWARVAVAIVVL